MDSAARMVALLERLQGYETVTADRLAEEFAVTARTVRRDVARLRDLGYDVRTARGVDGGYRVPPGSALPPVALSAEEAIVCTLALRRWEHVDDERFVTGALTKIGEAMPRRVLVAADAVAERTRVLDVDRVFEPEPQPTTATELGRLAEACRDGLRLEVAGARHDPLALVLAIGRWYVVAFDLDARRWSLLPVGDAPLTVTPTPATRRDPPADDLDAWATAWLADRTQSVRAVVRAHAPAARVRPGVAPAWGTVEPEGDDTCLVRCGADSYDVVARWLLLLGCPLTVVEPDELRDAFARVAAQATTTAGR